MSKQDITRRVHELRGYMRQHGLAAFIFPSTDPHNGEYVPGHWMTRQWISGFNGSAGTAVVTTTDAALWTDSRYFLAAAEQLDGTPFQLMRERVPGTPGISEWLRRLLQEGDTVGIDGWVNSVSTASSLRQELQASGILLDTSLDPAAALWEGRPEMPLHPVEIQPLEYAGERTVHKLARLREQIKAAGAQMTVICPLDEIAWICNLRGTDVHCNPVFVSYLLVSQEEATLFVDPRKLSAQVRAYLRRHPSLRGSGKRPGLHALKCHAHRPAVVQLPCRPAPRQGLEGNIPRLAHRTHEGHQERGRARGLPPGHAA